MDISLLAFGAAYHYGEPDKSEQVSEYNNFNPGLGFKLSMKVEDSYSETNINMVCGYYRNSIDNDSFFVGPGIEFGKDYGLQISIVHISGYYNTIYDTTVLIGGFYKYENFSFHSVFVGDGIGFYVEFEL